jgi:two-component system chemotaxis response regulator CheB
MRPSRPGEPPLSVLVVDDSAVVRQALAAILGREGFAVTTAADPLFAMQKMAAARPDVVVLDLEMPRMDGVTWLRRLMAENPLPVVICSALTGRFAHAAVGALEDGAVDVVTKPQLGVRDFLAESATQIVDTVRAAAAARVARRRPSGKAAALPLPALVKPAVPSRSVTAGGAGVAADTLVVVGASTGGTEALLSLLSGLPESSPGLAIVQHMPEGFTKAFAQRLNQVCRIAVKEAESGDRLLAGQALIARGNRHLVLHKSGSCYLVEVADGPLVSRHRPSVDLLFKSAAQAAGGNAIGVLLTGMGHDGADGLLALRRAGAHTIAQDEATSVVFGMPREAILLGAVEHVAPLPKIAELISRLAKGEKGPPETGPAARR